jgi:hypothetical protein
MVYDRIAAGETTVVQRLLYCDVESKWKNYHIITFPGQSLSKFWKSLWTCRKTDSFIKKDLDVGLW